MTRQLILTLYYERVVAPLEKECYKIEAKLHSRKISDFFARPIYWYRLKLYKQLLLDQYKKVGEWVTEEDPTMNRLLDKFPELWERNKKEW